MRKIGKPFANTSLVKFLQQEILKLNHLKNQSEISKQAGFRTPNVLSMIKTGESRLPLDRVVALAKALECDPALLFKLALEQQGVEHTREAVDQIFRGIVTENEAAWLQVIRDASRNSDPPLTGRTERALRAIFRA